MPSSLNYTTSTSHDSHVYTGDCSTSNSRSAAFARVDHMLKSAAYGSSKNISFNDRFITARRPFSAENFQMSIAMRQSNYYGGTKRSLEFGSYAHQLRAALSPTYEDSILTYGPKAPAPLMNGLNHTRGLYTQNVHYCSFGTDDEDDDEEEDDEEGDVCEADVEAENARLERYAELRHASTYGIGPPVSYSSCMPTVQERVIPKAPEKILDAPELLNDYYLNLLAYHPDQNIIAIGLGAAVYLYEVSTAKITKLLDYAENAGDSNSLLASDSGPAYVCSVDWMKGGHCLAVGNSRGETQVWDCTKMKRLRSMKGHGDRVGCLAWNRYTLSSGSKTGQILSFDVRIHHPVVAILQAHKQEVCGLKYAEHTDQLASGGNDNLVCIWDQTYLANMSKQDLETTPSKHLPLFANKSAHPLFTLTHHTAAVKALDWCPWSDYLLCSGGGTSDGTIKFWNTKTGSLVNSVNTGSQVSSLVWSKTSRELVSAHGHSQNQISLWRYPSLTKVADLHGHTARILNLALSPDGQTVVSAAGDESLRFWNVFESKQTELPKLLSRADPFGPGSLYTQKFCR